jgi:hypothetical protein
MGAHHQGVGKKIIKWLGMVLLLLPIVSSAADNTAMDLSINVKDCGAQVDGATDDAQALQRCLNMYHNVVISRGTMNIGRTIILNVGDTLSGAGKEPTTGTRIVYTGSGDALYAAPGTGHVTNYKGVITDLSIESAVGTSGIHLKDVSDYLIYNVYIHGNATGFSQACLWLDGTSGATGAMITTQIENVYLQNCKGWGIYAGGVNNVNAIYIHGSRIQGNQGGGVRFTSRTQGLAIMQTDIEGNSNIQAQFDDVEGLLITGCYFETSGEHSHMIWLRQSKGAIISGNRFQGSVPAMLTTVIRLGDAAHSLIAEGVIIQGNAIQGSTNVVLPEAAQHVLIGPNSLLQVKRHVGNWVWQGGFNRWISIVDPTDKIPVLMDVKTKRTSVANTSSETSIYTLNIPAGTLHMDGGVRFWVTGEYLNANAGKTDLTIRIKYGGVIKASLTWLAIPSDGDPRAFSLRGMLTAQESQGPKVQHADILGYLGPPGSTTTSAAPDIRFVTSNHTMGADADLNQTLEITVEHSVAAAKVLFNMDAIHAERLPW